MAQTINAMGKPCPQPVLLAKKELDKGVSELTILVDNDAAVENLRRLGDSQGYAVSVSDTPGGYAVSFAAAGTVKPPAEQEAPVSLCSCTGPAVFFIGKDHVGEGSEELGRSLMDMALYTLSQQEDPLPAAIVFMNGGVKIPCSEGQAVDSLRVLQQRGVRVLVCGTCLNYYELKDSLCTGVVSNMYEILTCLQSGTVISL